MEELSTFIRVDVSENDITILNENNMILGMVSIKETYSLTTFNMHFESYNEPFKAKLQKLMYKYSRTPIEDREEEKKYLVKIPIEWEYANRYFKKAKIPKLTFTPSKRDENAQFTEQEIKHYHLECFHRDEVK